MIRIGVISFPGSNCEAETLRAAEHVGAAAVSIWHRDRGLNGADVALVWSSPDSLTFLGDGRLQYEFREDRILIKYLNPPRANEEQTLWLGNFDALQAPVHNGTQRLPHEPVVAEWLFFPHPIHRQGVLLRFSKRTAVTLHLPPPLTAAIGQAAVRFPIRSGDEVALCFTTREDLPGTGR